MTNGVSTISVVRIRDNLLATIPADPSDETIEELQEKVLHELEKHNPDGLILDISNANIMDSFFARTLTETVKMVELMGGEVVIVGMQPSVAVTATELGYSLGDVETALNTDQALAILEEE